MRSTALWELGLRTCYVAVLLSTAAVACELPVRDAAFRMPRDVHHLCVIGRGDDAETEGIHAELTEWLAADGKSLNVELVRLDPDDPDVRWTEYGIPSAPDITPVVLLAGRNNGTGESFYIDHWQPGPTEEDLQALLASPIRDRLGEMLGTHVAVVVYSSVDPSGGHVQDVVTATLEKWQDRNKLGIEAIPLDRSDPDERALLMFAGIRPDGPDWCGLVFGQGKLMNPPLVGDEITAEALNKLFEQVLADCACSQPVPSLGVDLPMVWTSEFDEQVITLIDPEAEAEAEKEAGLTSPGAFSQANAVPAAETDTGGTLFTTVLWTIGGVVCLVVVAATFFVRKKPGI